MTNHEFLEKFSRKIIASGGDVSTAKTYSNNIGVFIGWGNFDHTSVLLCDQRKIEDYIIHLTEQKYSPPYINSFIASIKRLYRINGKYRECKKLEYHINEPKTPNVLTHEECMKMCNAPVYLKHRVIINLLYYGALRIGELLRLKTEHLCDDRKITIIDSKYGKSRVIVIPQHTLDLINKYIAEFKPNEYLFNGEKGFGPYSKKSVENIVKNTAKLCGIEKRTYPHLLRASWATVMLDNGASDMYVSEMLGHALIQTTRDYYCRLTKKGMQGNFDRVYDLLNNEPVVNENTVPA